MYRTYCEVETSSFEDSSLVSVRTDLKNGWFDIRLPIRKFGDLIAIKIRLLSFDFIRSFFEKFGVEIWKIRTKTFGYGF